MKYAGSALVIIFVSAPAISSFARSSHSSSSGDDFGKILALGAALLVGLVFVAINATKKPKRVSQEKVNQLAAEAQDFFAKLAATGNLTVPDTLLVTAADEQALLDEPSKLIEARATRMYAGGGTRLKGIYIGGGESSSFQSLKELDSGTLTLTTKRLVFTGSMESRVVNIKDIVSIEPFGADAIAVSTGKRVKRQVYVVRNPIIWSTFIPTLIKGAVRPLTKSADISTDIRFNCPRCGQHLCVEERGAGRPVNCPNCNEQIEIPRSSTAPPTPPPLLPSL